MYWTWLAGHESRRWAVRTDELDEPSEEQSDAADAGRPEMCRFRVFGRGMVTGDEVAISDVASSLRTSGLQHERVFVEEEDGHRPTWSEGCKRGMEKSSIQG